MFIIEWLQKSVTIFHSSLHYRFHWFWLLLYILTSFILYLKYKKGFALKKSFWSYILPEENYKLKKNLLLDFKYLLFGRLFYPVILGAIFVWTKYISEFVTYLLNLSFNEVYYKPTVFLQVLYGFALIASLDFGFYWAHRFTHTIPLLWRFHKVHHAITALNPVSNFRMHPVDIVLLRLFGVFFSSIVIGLFYFITNQEITTFKLLNTSVIIFLVTVFSNFRHSHIKISYGRYLDRFFSSPAVHQIHHSDRWKEMNSNYSFYFSFWDVLFGSFTLPLNAQDLKFGLPKGQDAPHLHNFWSSIIMPFRIKK